MANPPPRANSISEIPGKSTRPFPTPSVDSSARRSSALPARSGNISRPETRSAISPWGISTEAVSHSRADAGRDPRCASGRRDQLSALGRDALPASCGGRLHLPRNRHPVSGRVRDHRLGARPILYSAFRAVVNPGDRVLYTVPSWNNNHMPGSRARPRRKWRPARKTVSKPTLDALLPHLPEVRLLCMNSPLNPSGTMLDPERLRRITEAVVEENARRTRTGASTSSSSTIRSTDPSSSGHPAREPGGPRPGIGALGDLPRRHFEVVSPPPGCGSAGSSPPPRWRPG